MKLKSLGYITDLFFPRFDGLIRESENYLVVESPSNREFHWGNFLLFNKAPQFGDLLRWKELFRKEFSHAPEITHFAFGWDTTQQDLGASSEFINASFYLSDSVVLSATSVQAPRFLNPQVECRPLLTDEEWFAAVEMQVECRDPEHTLEAFRVFKVNRMKRYREMSEAGHGFFFGAYLNGRVVGSLGIYQDREIARFQTVVTSPRHRGVGICRSLVYQVSKFALEKMGAKTLVMVADDEGIARRIYEEVGFKPVEKQFGLSWWSR